MKTFQEVFEKVKKGGLKRVAVAAAADKPVLEAIREAVAMGLAGADLVGDEEQIKEIAGQIGLSLDHVRIINEPDPAKAALTAVKLVHDNEAQVVMKGLIGSADFLRAVLHKESGLRTGKILSSAAIIESKQMNRFLIMTDGGMVMYPGVEEKVQQLSNVLPICRALEIAEPKAAAICAVEVVNPAMSATIDAAQLSVMSQRGQIKGMIVDGPLALDNALDEAAAKHKGIISPVAGKADILLMPDIEAGNIFYKSLVYLSDVATGALIMGAAAPIVMTSRSDSAEAKLNSIAAAILVSGV